MLPMLREKSKQNYFPNEIRKQKTKIYDDSVTHYNISSMKMLLCVDFFYRIPMSWIKL